MANKKSNNSKSLPGSVVTVGLDISYGVVKAISGWLSARVNKQKSHEPGVLAKRAICYTIARNFGGVG
jgi:hypothetical protein